MYMYIQENTMVVTAAYMVSSVALLIMDSSITMQSHVNRRKWNVIELSSSTALCFMCSISELHRHASSTLRH